MRIGHQALLRAPGWSRWVILITTAVALVVSTGVYAYNRGAHSGRSFLADGEERRTKVTAAAGGNLRVGDG